ncbi:UPF0496 protein At1g20180-like [Macadamia integrifolia]|uniref:UPF0496 protein At1g20180-like n=1 Tax=Macadamia integrifolia TaxID=60698 RepID=UPI001C4EB1B2|nr:UPF0496 protein At1g20180-like [Macadamia integrifolia]
MEFRMEKNESEQCLRGVKSILSLPISINYKETFIENDEPEKSEREKVETQNDEPGKSETARGEEELGRCGSSKEHVSNVHRKLNVNEEYKEAFRTKSYVEICGEVQDQMRRTSITEDETFSSPSPFPSYKQLFDQLLEPPQEVLTTMIESCSASHHLRCLLVDYFECSLEACKICGFLLQSIDQTRSHYCKIHRIINLSKGLVMNSISDYTDDPCELIFRELASFADLANPLSGSTPVQFNLIHKRYELVLYKLTRTHKKLERRAKLIRLCKKALGISLVITCTTLAVVTLILAAHSLVGIAASPALFTASLGLLKRGIKSTRMKLSPSALSRVGAQLDAAAKGIYILNKDFDTVSRLVIRLQDEVEHIKDIAKMCLRNQSKQLLTEVVKEFKTNESCFLEKVGELEEHLYLCFLTIKKARRLVLQEIMVHSQGNNGIPTRDQQQ